MLEQIVNELVGDHPILPFSLNRILDSPEATEESVRGVHNLLRQYGLTAAKIASQAHLLGMSPKALQVNYLALRGMGLTAAKIALHAHLLGMSPETLQVNYQHHIGLLQEDFGNMMSGRDLLTNHAQLLGIPPITIEANVQYLHSTGMPYKNWLLLGTTAQTKRKKVAWILREIFDYRQAPQEQRRELINHAYAFIRDHPRILVNSVSTLQKTRDKLRDQAALYRRQTTPGFLPQPPQ